MTTDHTDTVTVLVVDDDRALADLYANWLESRHTVRRAYGGSEALEALDETVDVVFLDREMPGLDGDAVLEAIGCRHVDPRVVMVTAVEPTVDILDLPVADYLVKPVRRTDILDAVTDMLHRERYDNTLQEYFSLAAKTATLEAEKPPDELSASDAYQRVVTRLDELGERADGTVAGFDDEFEAVFRDVTAAEGSTRRR